MKDIKTLIIGFLLATCMFLIMGQGGYRSQAGTYQAFESTNEEGDSVTLMINTYTGQLYGLYENVQYLMDRPWKQYCAQITNNNWGWGMPNNCPTLHTGTPVHK